MVRVVVRWAPGRQFRLIGDGSYGTHELANALCPTSLYAALRRVSLVSRFPLEGATYAAPLPRSGRGRPRVKGAKLPSPRLLLALYSLNIAWFAHHVEDPGAWVRSRPWYPKKHVTFSDMLAAARHDILTELISSRPVAGMAASETGAPASSEPNPIGFVPRLTA